MQRLLEREKEMKREKEREEQRIREKTLLHQQFHQRYGLDHVSMSTDEGETASIGSRVRIQRQPLFMQSPSLPRPNQSPEEESPCSNKYSDILTKGLVVNASDERKLSDTPSQSKVTDEDSERKSSDTPSQSKTTDDSAICMQIEENLHVPSCSKTIRSTYISGRSAKDRHFSPHFRKGSRHRFPSEDMTDDDNDDDDDEEEDGTASPDRVMEVPDRLVRPKSLITQFKAQHIARRSEIGSAEQLDERTPGQRYSLLSYRDWLKEGQSKNEYVWTSFRPVAGLIRSKSEPRLPQANAVQQFRAKVDKIQVKKAQRQPPFEGKGSFTKSEPRSRSASRKRDSQEHRSASRKRDKWKGYRKLGETPSRNRSKKRLSVSSKDSNLDNISLSKDQSQALSSPLTNHVSRDSGKSLLAELAYTENSYMELLSSEQPLIIRFVSPRPLCLGDMVSNSLSESPHLRSFN
ncbi:hypothetical protein SK128_018840 [Halocaridina rubra]|uniref:Uncharacterized protein n=1 Tax=Halocaridina rubra TaxID=373956 RepID=A0AAN8WFP3_HALRR